ncbi:hypothetical protein LINPERHAP1_LOCUS21145 [Linum perenne]
MGLRARGRRSSVTGKPLAKSATFGQAPPSLAPNAPSSSTSAALLKESALNGLCTSTPCPPPSIMSVYTSFLPSFHYFFSN